MRHLGEGISGFVGVARARQVMFVVYLWSRVILSPVSCLLTSGCASASVCGIDTNIMVMQIKERCLLKIESIAFGGDGVGRAQGLVIFVPFTAPGDLAEIEIVLRKKRFARGRLIKIIEPSQQRTLPLCRYFGRCGGCSYQHIAYEEQLRIKQNQVKDAFLKIGKIAAPPLCEVLPSQQSYAYRGKALLHAAKTAGGWQLGFMDVSGRKIVDIESCAIMDETINLQIQQIKAAGNFASSGNDLILWSHSSGRPTEAVSRQVKGREFLVPHEGFFQANLYLVDKMVDEVCRLAGLQKRRIILDACCGSGLFSLFLAALAERLIGVEINEKSVSYARLNAANQGIINAEFVCGDLGYVLGEMARRKDEVDLIVLDPPRTGLSMDTLAALATLKSLDIIYVSCNPATQARDVRKLYDYGYVLQSLAPLDMFAQTAHIETVALLHLMDV